MIEQVVYVIRIVSLTIGMKKMTSPQERMNYVIKRLNMTKKWGGRFFFWKVIWRYYQIKYLISIPSSTKIGENFNIVHYGNIVINNAVIIGNNVSVAQGVTLGLAFGGKKQGCPQIGNNVYIGANSTIVGNVVIGENSFIAPNTFINFDVPNNSLVIGSPGTIHKRQKTLES